jgi:hypothetical protein
MSIWLFVPHRFRALRGSPNCGRCAVPWSVHHRPLRCALGLHDDGTDAFGGFSHTCLRCRRPI